MSHNETLTDGRPTGGDIAPRPAVNPRLIAPRNTARIVARDRLLTQLLDARRKRCVVLQGPAGCGKTTTLVAWREALLPLGFDVAWLTLAPTDNDLAECLDDLIASFALIDPALCREAAMLGGRGLDEEAVERTMIALVRGIATHPSDVVLVLDDLHQMTNARTHQALQWLLDYAPPNLHVVLVSRAALPLALGRLRDQSLVLELDMRDLRLTASESDAFLKAQIADLTTRDARRMHELADGWVAGLQLFAMNLKRRKPLSSEAMTSAQPSLLDSRAFADYFEREVLSRLSPPEVELLIRMATCTRLCGSLCVALVAREQRATDVLTTLARLETDNLFIAPIERSGNETWYRLNPLFRETLLERFNSRSESHRRGVHRSAWQWFRDHDHADEAVRHALLAGESAAAADLVQQIARSMQIRGDLRKLVALMRLLPAAEVEARIGLRLWMTQLHLYAREFDACASGLARLAIDIPADDTYSRYRLVLLRATLAVQQDDIDAAAASLPALLEPPGDADAMTIGARNNLLSWIYMRRGEYQQARATQRDTPPLLIDDAPLHGTSAGMLNGRCMVAFSYSLEGRYVQVERICRDVLAEADQLGSTAAEAACFAAVLLGEVLYEFNEPDAARKLLEDRVDVLERVSIPDSVLRVMTVLSSAHWLAGQPLDAFACLQRLEDYATQHGLQRLVAHSLAGQVHRHLQSGKFDAAECALARLDAMPSHVPPAQPCTRADIETLAQRVRIDWCLAHEDFDAAAARIRPLLARCIERGSLRDAAHFHLQAAIADFRRGRADAARESVLEALRLGHRLALVRTLLDAHPDALALIQRVMQGESNDPVLSFYVERLKAAQQKALTRCATASAQACAPGAAAVRAETLSERESRIVALLAQALPNKKIARTLGISPETVKWHLKNIYGKLGVSSRDGAVARVRDLGLNAAGSSTVADAAA